MKKSLYLSIPVLAAVLSANVYAAPCGKTRADVRAEIVALEAAGWNPADTDVHYPEGIRAAQGRLAAQHPQNTLPAPLAACEVY